MDSVFLVSVDMTGDDYEELLSLLRTCADVSAEMADGNSVLADLAADFRFFIDLLESNRR